MSSSDEMIEEALSEAVSLIKEMYEAGHWTLQDHHPRATDGVVYWDRAKELLKQHRMYDPSWRDLG